MFMRLLRRIERLEKKVSDLEDRPLQINVQSGGHFHHWQDAEGKWHFHKDSGAAAIAKGESE